MTCPMTKNLPITENQSKNFCKHGCSIDCEKIFNEKFRIIGGGGEEWKIQKKAK